VSYSIRPRLCATIALFATSIKLVLFSINRSTVFDEANTVLCNLYEVKQTASRIQFLIRRRYHHSVVQLGETRRLSHPLTSSLLWDASHVVLSSFRQWHSMGLLVAAHCTLFPVGRDTCSSHGDVELGRPSPANRLVKPVPGEAKSMSEAVSSAMSSLSWSDAILPDLVDLQTTI
jgi:hypothetical protein